MPIESDGPEQSAQDRLKNAFADEVGPAAGSPKMMAFVDAQTLVQAESDIVEHQRGSYSSSEGAGLISAATTKALVEDRMTQRFFESPAYALASGTALEIAEQYRGEGKIHEMKRDLVEISYGSQASKLLLGNR